MYNTRADKAVAQVYSGTNPIIVFYFMFPKMFQETGKNEGNANSEVQT